MVLLPSKMVLPPSKMVLPPSKMVIPQAMDWVQYWFCVLSKKICGKSQKICGDISPQSPAFCMYALRQLWDNFSETLGHLWIIFGTHLRHLGDNFWTTDNFGTIWWLLSDCRQSIPLPRGQHIGIFKIRFYSILQHFERCECPICPNQKNCVTFNFQVYCSRLYLHSVHIANCLYPRIHKGAPWCHT